jgi:hypothetical protein
VAHGPIVLACGQTALEPADPTVQAQAGRAGAGLTDRAQADLTDPGFDQTVRKRAGQSGLEQSDPERADQSGRERADQSGRGIAPKVPVSAGPNVPPRVLNAQHNVPPSVRNVPPRAGRRTSGAGRQVRNTGGMQDHNNDLARNRRTGRLNDSKAVHDLSNAHGHNNRRVRASITHVRDKVAAAAVVVVVVAVHDRTSARSARDLSRTRPSNNPV